LHHDKGFLIWYDEGIDPGSEFSESIAKHLIAASVVLCFVSPSAVQSHNVRNEIYLAEEERIPMLYVHLEETKLRPGLRLMVGAKQAIYYYRYPSPADFHTKIEQALKPLVGRRTT